MPWAIRCETAADRVRASRRSGAPLRAAAGPCTGDGDGGPLRRGQQVRCGLRCRRPRQRAGSLQSDRSTWSTGQEAASRRPRQLRPGDPEAMNRTDGDRRERTAEPGQVGRDAPATDPGQRAAPRQRPVARVAGLSPRRARPPRTRPWLRRPRPARPPADDRPPAGEGQARPTTRQPPRPAAATPSHTTGAPTRSVGTPPDARRSAQDDVPWRTPPSSSSSCAHCCCSPRPRSPSRRLRVTQTRTDAVRRELTQNNEKARERGGLILCSVAATSGPATLLTESSAHETGRSQEFEERRPSVSSRDWKRCWCGPQSSG